MRVMTLSQALLLLVSSLGLGQEEGKIPEEAQKLVFEFEVMEEGIISKAPLDSLLTNYGKHLEKLQAALQEKGDLDGALALSKERETIAAGQAGEVTENDPPELAKARHLYDEAREKMISEVSAEVLPLRKKLIEDLGTVIEELTKAGRIDDALATKARFDAEVEKLNEVSLPKPAPRGLSEGRISFKLQIDGRSYLLLRGDEVWYDHRGGAWTKPGLHNGNFPTTINRNVEWLPKWNDKVTERFDADLGLPTDGDPYTVKVRVSNGRGIAKVIQPPTPENDWTTKIELFDGTEEGKGFGNSSWLDFRVDWER
ncbi:MAG: hypothetical protein P1U85_05275 [Verrucomicrobiales bacterium]|nr:hypothetical protein [Verrucomicrobiales bacterium]